jgi:Na+-transporting NADH:ubiquinone oxidoreductase subunit NqrD
MDKVFNYLNGFFSGLAGVLLTLLPLTILWEVLTGGMLFGMDVIANLTALVNGFGTGGFAGLVVLVLVASFFVKK